MSTHSKVIAQTDRHTHTHRQTHRHDENITSTAYAGGNNYLIITINAFQLNFSSNVMELATKL